MIAVMVGPQATGTRFLFHADLVSQHSDFFQARPEEGWKEAEERIVRLPDLPADSATAFEDFHSFLYTGKVYSAKEGEENAPGVDNEWTRLVWAWILGEVLLSVSFKDAVLDALLHKLAPKGRYPTGMSFLAYKYSSESSPFRRLMVDIAVHRWDKETMSKSIFGKEEATLAPFFQSIAVALLEWKLQPKDSKKTEDPAQWEGTCYYHEHGDKPCYKTMF